MEGGGESRKFSVLLHSTIKPSVQIRIYRVENNSWNLTNQYQYRNYLYLFHSSIELIFVFNKKGRLWKSNRIYHLTDGRAHIEGWNISQVMNNSETGRQSSYFFSLFFTLFIMYQYHIYISSSGSDIQGDKIQRNKNSVRQRYFSFSFSPSKKLETFVLSKPTREPCDFYGNFTRCRCKFSFLNAGEITRKLTWKLLINI